eukprot:CAMPEP_0184654800 /NCGR_PEP_ID=MMETSP0308-20130426/12458_1 /TAXON_ID=38269 /ORGANISM="Gloeochaete witrockiana, Strain SAG 46.84" /LENGTH=233 /DNA_ID=CAMNT_0027090951 /DNA_START=174 /DNA_END=875 /DNA_ORIENTATION=+
MFPLAFLSPAPEYRKDDVPWIREDHREELEAELKKIQIMEQYALMSIFSLSGRAASLRDPSTMTLSNDRNSAIVLSDDDEVSDGDGKLKGEEDRLVQIAIAKSLEGGRQPMRKELAKDDATKFNVGEKGRRKLLADICEARRLANAESAVGQHNTTTTPNPNPNPKGDTDVNSDTSTELDEDGHITDLDTSLVLVTCKGPSSSATVSPRANSNSNTEEEEEELAMAIALSLAS